MTCKSPHDFLFGSFMTPSAKKELELSKRTRRLYFETLERREYLAADLGAGCGPVYVDPFTIRPENLDLWTSVGTADSVGTLETENEPVPVSYADVYAAAVFSEIEELIESVSLGEATTETVSPAFVDNGENFYGIDQIASLNASEPTIRRVVFASQLGDDEPKGDVCVIDDSEESTPLTLSDYGSGGSETWNLSLTVTTHSSLSSDLSSIALSEGRPLSVGSYDPLSNADYFTITLPALPDNYVCSISLFGTASFGSDYYAYTQYNNNLYSVSSSTIYYSGGGTTLYVVPFGDSIVEDHETIRASLGTPELVGSGGGDTPVFVNGVTSVTATIVDDDALELTSVSFRNNLNLISDTQGSFGMSWQSGPHWISSDSTATLPIAYACNDVLQMLANISGSYQAERCEVKAVRVGGGETEWIDFTASGNRLYTFTESFTEIFGYQQGCYISDSTVIWKFRLNGGEERSFATNADRSVNPLYITYKSPTVGVNDYLFHTSVHHSCVAAGTVNYWQVEADDTAEVVAAKIEVNCDRIYQAVCTKFGSLNVEKINLVDGNIQVGETLTYYGKNVLNADDYSSVKQLIACTETDDGVIFDQQPTRAREFTQSFYPVGGTMNCSTFTKNGLLYFLDGTCGSWQSFMINILCSQGLTDVSPINITISHRNNANQKVYYNFKIDSTLRGQGGQVPMENTWINHVFIKYKNWYYDPSYAIHYGTSLSLLKNSFCTSVVSIGSVVSVLDNEVENTNQYAGFGRVYYSLDVASSVYVTWICVE